MSTDKDIIRIANISGFYGDRLSAAREMVEGGPVDVLTGDYLAELTMAILHGKRVQDEKTGYVGTFLKQVRQVIEPCLQKGIKIVTNAGGLNPSGMAEQVEAIIKELGLTAKVAWIEGDNLVPRLEELQSQGELFTNIDTGAPLSECRENPVTANAYLGIWGIKEALDQGADIVICPRVTDAAVVMGPAAWKFNWQRDDYDALAGALVAGHLIECGPSVAGGNYAFFQEVPSFHNMGFPIAEIEANGHFTLTKHPGTGGLISVGTVTAQLLYEINGPAYLNPDVIAHFNTVKLEQVGDDRVYVSRCRGSAPPPTHKVCINTRGTYRNAMEYLLTGLDIDEKAKIITDELFASLGGKDQFDHVEVQVLHTQHQNPKLYDAAFATLRIIVESRDPKVVGKHFNQKAVELGLGSYPGLFGRGPTIPTGALTRHWPALVDSKHIIEKVYCDGKLSEVKPTSQLGLAPYRFEPEPVTVPKTPEADLVSIPLGRLFGTRSGDKGGCANVGIWAKTDAAYQFLYHFLTAEQFQELLPDMRAFNVERFEFPNVRGLNFFVHDILGEGIAATTFTDGQAKALGEYLRAQVIEVPEALVKNL